MIRNALTLAVRTVKRRPGTTFINVGGLAVGLAACLLIGLYVYHQLSYDAFHENGDRIYRVVKDVTTEGETIRSAITSAPAGPAIEAEFASVEASVRFFTGTADLRIGDTNLDLQETRFVDATFFDVFSFDLRHGDPASALDEPDEVVLSAEVAERYFGSENPVGRTLQEATLGTVTVSGVLEPIPTASTIQGDVFFSLRTLQAVFPEQLNSWFANGLATYLLLENGADADALEAQLPAFLNRRIAGEMEDLGITNALYLEPLSDTYLHSDRINQMWATGSATNVWLFGTIALLILGIACVNFTNIATARASERSTEVGVRKSLGADRAQLIRQFLGEAALLSFVSVGGAGLLASLSLPAFNRLAGTALAWDVVPVWTIAATLLGLGVLAAVLSGLYPAFVLARQGSAGVLRASRGTVGRGGSMRFRQGLIVVQFAIAVGLIACTAIIYAQLDHLQSRDLGFQKERMLVLEGRVDGLDRVETVRQEMTALPGVTAATATAGVPSIGEGTWLTTMYRDGTSMRSNIALYTVDAKFLDVYDLEIVAGRAFGRESDAETALILNETAVRHFGFDAPEDAIGARFDQLGRSGTVVGVVEDYHYQSMHEPIGPLSLRPLQETITTVTLQLAPGSLPDVMDAVEAKWAALAPAQRFNAQFLDDRFDRLYRAERRFGNVFGAASGLALTLACLGLFGLVAITVRQRRQEIGVRKVLGASALRIVKMLSTEVLILVGIAAVIAIPVAYLGTSQWLDGFAVQVGLGPTWFVVAALAVAAVAGATTCVHAIRAARLNPADTLRDE